MTRGMFRARPATTKNQSVSPARARARSGQSCLGTYQVRARHDKNELALADPAWAYMDRPIDKQYGITSFIDFLFEVARVVFLCECRGGCVIFAMLSLALYNS